MFTAVSVTGVNYLHRRLCYLRSASVYLSVCPQRCVVSGRRAAATRRSSRGGEGNAPFPGLSYFISSYLCFIISVLIYRTFSLCHLRSVLTTILINEYCIVLYCLAWSIVHLCVTQLGYSLAILRARQCLHSVVII